MDPFLQFAQQKEQNKCCHRSMGSLSASAQTFSPAFWISDQVIRNSELVPFFNSSEINRLPSSFAMQSLEDEAGNSCFKRDVFDEGSSYRYVSPFMLSGIPGTTSNMFLEANEAPCEQSSVPLNASLQQYINPNANGRAMQALEAHYGKAFSSNISDTYKTVMCQTWLETASCRFGQNCKFAHGEDELRHTNVKPRLAGNRLYKTRPCEKFVNKGICPYGRRCLFIHPESPAVVKSPSVVTNASGKKPEVAFKEPSRISLVAKDFSSLHLSDLWAVPKIEKQDQSSALPPSLSTIWSSDECAGSGTTTTSFGSPTDRIVTSANSGQQKEISSNSGKGRFDDSASCLTELRDRLASGMLEMK